MGCKCRIIYLLTILVLMLCACGTNTGNEITEITVNAENAKYWYVSGEEIDPSGLVITAHLSNGNTVKVDPMECEFIKPAFAPYGEKEVTVVFKGMKGAYSIYTCPSIVENDEYITYLIRMNENGSRVTLTTVLCESNQPYVLIFPGGAYQTCSPYGNEGYAYAAEIKAAGYNAFILEYSTETEHPAPLEDVNTAMEIIADCQKSWGVSLDHYAVMGSSAGGHLAATWCMKEIGYQKYNQERPAAVLLAYAATNMEDGILDALLGDNADPALRTLLSVDKHIDSEYPPTYQWVFDEDNLGITRHTMLMDAALTDAGVDHLTRVYAGAAHGTGLSIGLSSEGWIDEAISFWEQQMH